MRLMKAALHASLITLIAATGALAGTGESLRLINDALTAGEISGSQANLYRLYAIREPSGLPARFREVSGARRFSVESGPVERCLTPHLMGVRASLSEMNQADRARAEELLSVGGVPIEGEGQSKSAKVFAKTALHTLRHYATTANFSIEWGDTLTNEDGSPVTISGGDGIPDVVKLWAAYFEHALATFQAMGFTETPALNSYKVQILIGNSDSASVADNIDSRYYGLTDGDIPHTPGNPPAVIIVNNNFAAIVADNPNDESAFGPVAGTRGAMMATAAHELSHLIQFIYAPGYWSGAASLNADRWWTEATSTWAEDEVYPFVNDYRQYYNGSLGWANYPHLTLAWPFDRSYGTPLQTSRIYGSAIFAKYVSEHAGGPETVVEVWKNLKSGASLSNSFSLAADTATGQAGYWSLNDLFLGFVGANATMDYDDGYFYGTVPTSIASAPERLGASFSDLTLTGDGPLAFTLNGQLPASGWGVSVVRRKAAGDAYKANLTSTSPSLSTKALNGETLSLIGAFFGPQTSSTSYGSSTLAAVLTDEVPPTAPQSLSLTPLHEGFQASWLPAADNVAVSGYVLFWKKDTDAAWQSRTLNGPVTRALVRNLSPDASYEFKVCAYDSSGNEGPETAPTAGLSGPQAVRPDMNVTIVSSGDYTPPAPIGGGGGGGGGGGCMINTLLDR